MNLINFQKDTKSKSLSEAFVNSFGSYPIGYAVGVLVLPLSLGWLQKDVFTANIFITLIYASISFIRTYYLRRVFEKLRIDDNFLRIMIKGLQRFHMFYRRKKHVTKS